MPPTKNILVWQAPEFIKYQKTILWDFGVFIVALLFAFWGVWQHDFTIIILAILGGVLFWHYGTKEPREVTFAIRPDGIQVDALLYRYRNITSFCIFHEPPHLNELVIRNKTSLVPLVHINLGANDPQKVKKILKEYIPEQEETYPLSHVISHIIGY